jgi:hypothetical protein
LLRVSCEINTVLSDVDGFCSCPLLSLVILPPSVKTIGPLGFSDCRSLISIRFAGITEMNSKKQKRYQDKPQPRLPELRIPKWCELKTISGLNHSTMDSFEIPGSVTKIDGCNGKGMAVLGICVGIGMIVFEENSVLREIDGFSPPAMGSITIPNSVEIIGEGAFIAAVDEVNGERWSFCLLETIVFCPGSKLKQVLGIQHCPRLQPVVLYGKLEVIGERAFTDCGSGPFEVTLRGSCEEVRPSLEGMRVMIVESIPGSPVA